MRITTTLRGVFTFNDCLDYVAGFLNSPLEYRAKYRANVLDVTRLAYILCLEGKEV